MVLNKLLPTFILLYLLNSVHSANKLAEIYADVEYSSDIGWLLTDIFHQITDKVQCFGILVDRYYQGTILAKMDLIFNSKPHFRILVEEYEDLLSPNYNTLKVITEVKKTGCNLYVILLSNGEQLARLLMFADRYRTIDTRANFIFMHDRRLFSKKYFYLWKKVINVVFIRQYENTVRFDISTTPFPAPVTNVIMPYTINTWRKGSFQKNINLFRDKTSNLRGQVLNVVTFEHIPSTVVTYGVTRSLNGSIEDEDSIYKIYSGLEIQVLQTLGDAMNFKYLIYEAENSAVELWGHKQLNGSFSGLLGEISEGKADIALGNLYYTPYHLQMVDLSIPYNTECLTFLTPESLRDNSWETLIRPFQGNMWIAVGIMLLISGSTFYILANYHRFIEHKDFSKNNSKINNGSKKWIVKYLKSTRVWEYFISLIQSLKRRCIKTNRKKQFLKEHNAVYEKKHHLRKRNFGRRLTQIIISAGENEETKSQGLYIFENLDNSFLYTYGTLLAVSLPKIPTGWSIRVLTGWWLLYCILVAVAYRASLTAILATPAQRVTIDTLQGLAESNIACGGWGEQSKEFFVTSLDTASQQVGRKFEVTYDVDDALKRIENGKFAYYENIHYLRYLTVKRKGCGSEYCNITEDEGVTVKENGQILHIMNDCVINMPISIGVQKNSPLKVTIDNFILKVIEAGLVKKWLNDVMFKTLTAEAKSTKGEIKALMNLSKLYGAVVFLLAGYIVSTLVLIVEIIVWKCIVQKDPLFDEYDIGGYYRRK